MHMSVMSKFGHLAITQKIRQFDDSIMALLKQLKNEFSSPCDIVKHVRHGAVEANLLNSLILDEIMMT